MSSWKKGPWHASMSLAPHAHREWPIGCAFWVNRHTDLYYGDQMPSKALVIVMAVVVFRFWQLVIPFHLSETGFKLLRPHRAILIILPLSLTSESVNRSVVSNLFNPTDGSLPGFSVHGISQARILMWVAIPFSRESSRPRDKPRSSALWANSLPSEPPGKPTPQST